MIIEAPESQYGLPESGEYTVKLASYENLGEQPDPYNPGKMKKRLKLVWALPDNFGGFSEDGPTQWDWVTASIHPQATLYEIATYLLGQTPPKKFDLDILIGRSCRVVIQQSKGEDGKARSRVVNYLPLMNPNPQPAPASPITDNDLPF